MAMREGQELPILSPPIGFTFDELDELYQALELKREMQGESALNWSLHTWACEAMSSVRIERQ